MTGKDPIEVPEGTYIPSKLALKIQGLLPRSIRRAAAFSFVASCASFSKDGLKTTLEDVIADIEDIE